MKRTYEAPRMDICRFQAEDIMSLSDLFNSFNAEKDNEGNWKAEWN